MTQYFLCAKYKKNKFSDISFAGTELGFDTGGEPECQHRVMTSGRDSEGQIYPACFATSISAVLINIERL